jgi:hypothetical protein
VPDVDEDSDGDSANTSAPLRPNWRFGPQYRWRYGPVRITMPWVCIALGILFTVRGSQGLSRSGDQNTTELFWIGVGLIVLGVIGFFVARWMAKRGL